MSSLELTSDSEFLPPRAGFWSRVAARSPMYGLRRFLSARGLFHDTGFPVSRFLIAVVLPGFGFFLGRTTSRWMQRFTILVPVLLLLTVIWIGRPFGNLLLTVLISFHVTSVLYAVEPFLASNTLKFRIIFSALVMLCMWTLVYGPMRGLVERHLFMPLDHRGNVLIVNPNFRASGVVPGDLMAMQLQDSAAGNNIIMHRGISLGTVLAMPGDTVVFGAGEYYRNGARMIALPNMPAEGQLVLDKKTWLVWPDVVTRGGGATARDIALVLLKQSMVTEAELKGKVFRRWFWWRQL